MRISLQRASWALLLIEVALLLVTYVALLSNAIELREYYLRSLVVVSNKGSKDFNPETIKLHIISLFLNTSWQQSFLMKIMVNGSHTGYTLNKDVDGNPIAILNLSAIPPRGKLRIVYEQRVLERYPKELAFTGPDPSEHLSGGGLWQVEDLSLRALASTIMRSVRRADDSQLLLEIVRWIHNHIQYGSRMPPRYPREVLDERTGDCDEQAALLGTLCRILGLPAFLRIGCVYRPGSYKQDTFFGGHVSLELVNIGWHAWARVFLKGLGWVPVDLTYYVYRTGGPADSIEGAAVNLKGTLVLATISRQDYIAEAKAVESLLKEFNVYIFERDELFLVRVRVFVRWDVKLVLLMATIVTIAIAELVILAKLKGLLRRKESSQEGYAMSKNLRIR